jgi:transposase-like protein
VPIVWPCPLPVERYAELGREVDPPRPACPSCGGRTQRWHGYHRHVRDDRDRLIWIARVRCTACGVTRALLPSFVLSRRWDTVAHVGRAVELAASGLGHRPVAALLVRSETTVRDWLRRIRSVATTLTTTLLARAVALGWTGFDLPVAPLPRLVAAVRALAGRWPGDRSAGPWAIALLVTGGRLLATNTTTPLERTSGSGAMAGPPLEEASHDP